MPWRYVHTRRSRAKASARRRFATAGPDASQDLYWERTSMPTSAAERERRLTDQSLAEERAKADAALAEKAAIERTAAEDIERARDEADQVLAAAREAADEKLDTATTREQTDSA